MKLPSLHTSILITFLITTGVACTHHPKKTAGKYFEGKVTYKSTVSYMKEDSDKVYSGELYNSTFYFKEGNWKQVYDNGPIYEEIFITKENKSYVKKASRDTLFYIDERTPGDSIEKYEIHEGVAKIMGISCNELKIWYKDKTASYYYNPDYLKLNKAWFKDFINFNKNFTTEKMGTLFLRYKVELNNKRTIFITATGISEEEIDDKEFKLPGHKVLAKYEQ